jgi:NADH-quinone oxidoreductase subunit L
LLNLETNLVWTLPLICAVSFCLITFLGKYLPLRGAFISIIAIGICFVLFWFILKDFIAHNWIVSVYDFDWIIIGEWKITWGFAVDRISIVMVGLITFVALLVQIYSLGYMKGDSRFGWYYAVHSLFAAAMLLLVLADNLLFLYFAWELVGLGSYLLIGFWYQRRPAAEAAKKAFITTRIGDVGLLIGIILVFNATGTFHITSIIHAAQEGAISETVMFWSALLIFVGAMGKSAQFPLHVWLPDAMEGPTPVSALIHAATMVAAGIYLVGRMMPFFEMIPSVLNIISIIGIFTFLAAGSIALVMKDIKKVLAYSTISHLGLMMLSLGAVGVSAAFFHLIVHGFSKALLFLGAGSVMHGMKEHTDLNLMGGLLKKMPITSITFLFGVLSLAGILPFGGFFSKDEILISVFHGLNPTFLILTMVGVFLSALYMVRLYCLVFIGKPRSKEAKAAHESPYVMSIPLIILAVLALVSGFFALPIPINGYEGFGTVIDSYHHFEMIPWLAIWSLAISISGIILGWLIYGKGYWSSTQITSKSYRLYKIILDKYYFDEVYQWIINKVILAFAKFLTVFDRVIVNDTGIDGIGISIQKSAVKIRLMQTGQVYNYALSMILGILFVVILWWLI